MSKFKVGDKVRRVKDLGSTFDSSFSYVITGFVPDGCFSLQGLVGYWDDRCFDLIIDDHWSACNNTKPLSELSDEQAAELFNHWRKCDDVETYDTFNEEWIFLNVEWDDKCIYRAKQKSERELFIEAAFNTCPIFTETKYDHEQLLNAMFDAGFKAPKVGE